MSSLAARYHQTDIPASAAPEQADQSGAAVETAVVVDTLDRLISGRVNDLDLLKSIAAGLKAGAPSDDVHRKLLALARSSREAFRSLQNSRDALVAMHKKSSGGEMAEVIDHATGLPNRAAFEAKLRAAFENSPSDTVVMMIEFGALQGLATEAGRNDADRIIKRFGTILKRTIKQSDFIARFSPFCFVIMFRKVLPDNVAPIALRIHEVMQAQLAPGRDPVMRRLSVTIGITGRKAADVTSADLLKSAQGTLVEARKRGGTGIYVA